MLTRYVVLLLLTELSNAYDVTSLIFINPKYELATKVAAQAAYIQSGYSGKVNNIKDVSSSKAMKLIKVIGLSKAVAIGSTVVPILLEKRVEIHTGNFILNGSVNKKEIDWIIGF